MKEAFTLSLTMVGNSSAVSLALLEPSLKTVKASLNGVVDSSEKFLSRVNDAGTSFTDVIDTAEAPK